MTDINQDYSSQKTSVKRRQKKLNLRIDMTPMVDLGFLLIAFFIFTTQMINPHATNLIMPKDVGPKMRVKESKSLTVLIGNKSDLYYYYFGKEENAIKEQLIKQSGYSETEIGNLIRQKQLALGTERNDLMVIIKAAKNANYKNVVDILDEMLINRVKKYAIAELGEGEAAFLDAR
jgi:biopolymer transport protein ExbD